jgi:hypothetical protein
MTKPQTFSILLQFAAVIIHFDNCRECKLDNFTRRSSNADAVLALDVPSLDVPLGPVRERLDKDASHQVQQRGTRMEAISRGVKDRVKSGS